MTCGEDDPQVQGLDVAEVILVAPDAPKRWLVATRRGGAVRRSALETVGF